MTAHRKGESENSMKKTKILVPVLALGLLAGCAPRTTSETTSSTSTTPTAVPTTFAEQCKAAGIAFTYEDPNAAIYEKETKPADEADIDAVTAEGTLETSYTAAAGGSYYTYEYMIERSNLNYSHYYWEDIENWKPSPYNPTEAAPAAADTLQEAAALTNAKYVTDLFPEDGKEYYVASYSNKLATKTFVSEGTDGVIHTAVYNLGGSYDAETNTASFVPGITSVDGIGSAILESGKATMIMYEYNPTSGDKVGPGARNFGARMELTLNLEKSTLMLEDMTTIEGSAIGNIGDALPENAYYFHPYLEVTAMYSLG